MYFRDTFFTEFGLYCRKLDLSLHAADDGIFLADATISTDGVDSEFDSSHLYNGYIKGTAIYFYAYANCLLALLTS